MKKDNKPFIKTLLIKHKVVALSFAILLFWVLAAIGNFVFPSLYSTPIDLSLRLLFPGEEKFFLGTNTNGQSLALLILSGAKSSLVISLATVSLCVFIGVMLGSVAGYFGGILDIIISRLIDILLAFPPLLLPIAITAFVGGGAWNIILALSVTGWVSYARLIRGQFILYRERDFVLAAKAIGTNHFKIMFKHIFPCTLSPLIVQSTFSLASVIIAEAGLSFLGLGLSLEEGASWGALINTGKDYLTSHPFLIFFPSLAIFSIVFALNDIGETIRISFDPKHSKGAGFL